MLFASQQKQAIDLQHRLTALKTNNRAILNATVALLIKGHLNYKNASSRFQSLS